MCLAACALLWGKAYQHWWFTDQRLTETTDV